MTQCSGPDPLTMDEYNTRDGPKDPDALHLLVRKYSSEYIGHYNTTQRPTVISKERSFCVTKAYLRSKRREKRYCVWVPKNGLHFTGPDGAGGKCAKPYYLPFLSQAGHYVYVEDFPMMRLLYSNLSLIHI